MASIVRDEGAFGLTRLTAGSINNPHCHFNYLKEHQNMSIETTLVTKTLRVAVIGAGGKMGMRISDSLVKTDNAVY